VIKILKPSIQTSSLSPAFLSRKLEDVCFVPLECR
jgi:hypothetical protein